MNSTANFPDYIKKYLKKFSSDYWKISKDLKKVFNNVIVIPSLAEFDYLPKCIKSLEQNDKRFLNDTLILVVINNSVSSSSEIKTNNEMTIDYLKSYNGNLNLSFIDASSEVNAIPDKYAGVGMARKIGCDLALTKFNFLNPDKKLIFFLDADCIVSPDYLGKVISEFNKKNLHSAVIEYEHQYSENTPEAEAIICYEIFLRYHRLGLTYSKCYYDYHTIGSTIVFDAESYIKAGGMNRRKAGEDYYFLEKLAKQNKIYTIKDALVFPSARKSWRVPFGTGQRITRHLSKKKNEYVAYNPESFKVLKKWLKIFLSDKIIGTKDIISEAKNLSPTLYNFLSKQNFENDWKKILKNNISTNEIQKQKIFWFDAFRTLKLIHSLRDNVYPDINLFEAVDQMLKMMHIKSEIKRDKSIPDIQIQKQYLLFLREVLRKDNSDDNKN